MTSSFSFSWGQFPLPHPHAGARAYMYRRDLNRRHLNERVSASAVDWSGDEAAMSLIGSPTDGSFIVTHTPDGSSQLLYQHTVLILVKI